MSSATILTDERARGFASSVESLRYSGLLLDELEVTPFVMRSIKRQDRVLDVGCGTGGLAQHLRDQLDCDVTGVEPNPERAAFAKANGIKVFVGYLNDDFCVSNRDFDIILFIDVLEHVADPVEILNIARMALRDNGKVIISVPNIAHWTVRFKLLLGKFDYKPTGIMDATHLRWFTARTAVDVVRAAHFTIEEQSVSRGTWMAAYSLRRPWKWLSERRRRWVLNKLCRYWPGLFGCQHLLVAKAVA